MGWAECVRSALRRDGRGGGTAAARRAGGTGGTGSPESGGSSPGEAGREISTGQGQTSTLHVRLCVDAGGEA